MSDPISQIENLKQALKNLLCDHYDEQEYLSAWGVLPHYRMLNNLHDRRAASTIDWHTVPIAQVASMLVYYSGIYLYNKVYRTCGLDDKRATRLAEETVKRFETDAWSRQ